MRLRSLVFLASTLTLFYASAIAQVQPKADAEKDKLTKEQKERIVQMLDESIVAANALRLPENRASLLAMAGDLYWKFDDKRARELFRSAAADIINFYAEADREKHDNSGTMVFQLSDPNDVRPLIMPLIAKHDATLALELLLQTRPAKLAEAMLKASQPNNKGTMDLVNLNMDQFRVQQEIALEQQFAYLAAEEDPDKAIALIKDSLAKGVSGSVMPLLQKLFKKDEKKAAELGGDVIKKLVDSDMTKNQTDMFTALSFLQNAAKATPAPPGTGDSSTSSGLSATTATAGTTTEKQFAFSDSQIRDLANKLATTLLQPSSSSSIINSAILSQAIPILEKIIPDRAALLKQRQAESQRAMPSELKGMQDLQKVFDPNATPEDILSQLAKMPDGPIKSQAYPALEGKIGQITDEARAKKLIDQISDDKERANAQEKYDSAKIARTAATGKLEDARQMIGSMTNKRDRIQKLVALAQQYFKRGKDTDIEAAKSIMKDAKALTSDMPSDSDEISDLMEVIKGYAVIEPDLAFRMFEPVIDQLNEYVQASAVLSKYEQRRQDFRNGELVLSMNAYQRGGGTLTFRYIPHIQALGKADLEHMGQLTERFVRPDYRAAVMLYVLQGFLADDKKPAAAIPQPVTSTVVISN